MAARRYAWLPAVLVIVSACVPAPTRELTPSELHFLKEYTAPAGDSPITNMDDNEAREYLARIVDNDIDIHGLVVDADGQPIKDAKVRALVLNRPLKKLVPPYLTGPITPTQTTSANGTFRIHNIQGAAILVEATAEGYAAIGDARKVFFIDPEIKQSNEEPIPSADLPTVFTFRSLEDGELRSFASGSVPLPTDGSPVEIAIRRLTPYGVDAGTGELKVSLVRGPANQQGRYDWEVHVSVPGGGIQSYSDVRQTSAPEDGYQKDLVFRVDADSAQWRDRGERDLFLRLADGTYALALVKVRTREQAYFSVSGKWNDAGERYVF